MAWMPSVLVRLSPNENRNLSRPEPLTNRQKSRIRLLAKNHTKPQIAERIGAPLSQVTRFCTNHEIRTKPARYSPLEGLDLETLVLEHGSVQKVADKFGVSRSAVYQRLEQQEGEVDE